MKPFLFKKVKGGNGYSFWLIDTSNSYKVNYALLINNDVIRIVKINLKPVSKSSMEISIFKDIISLSNDYDLKKLLQKFSRLEIKKPLSIKKVYNSIECIPLNSENFIDCIKEKCVKEDSEKQNIDCIKEKYIKEDNEKQNLEKFFIFILIMYEYIYNKELKYSMPLWFRNSFIIKAITLKLKYELLDSFYEFFGNDNSLESSKHRDDFKEACKNWINFCLDNWNVNLNYPPILENFPEGEIKKVLNDKNILIWLKEDKEWKEVIKNALTFFLRRYDIKNVIINLILYLWPNSLKLPNFLFYLLVGAIVLFFITLPFYLKPFFGNISLGFLSVVLLTLYVLFFAITQKIFFPRALFGSTVAWTILSSVPEVRNLPEKLLKINNFHQIINYAKDSSFYLKFFFIIFIFLFIIVVMIYIISEMETFIKDIPWRKKVERAFTLLIFIYSIAFATGYIFAYDLIISNSLKDLLKYYYLTSIATFISIAAQIMWEDKPITEV